MNEDDSGSAARSNAALIGRILDVLQLEILPDTNAAIEAGNKIFGAAVLDRCSLKTVTIGTNEETTNPLLHGEVACLNRYWSLNREDRPDPQDCLFISTHEPCSLCLSAITWSGFDNFYFLFSYEDSRDAFNIPHDLNILKEVFGVEGGAYRSSNAYWTSYSIGDLVDQHCGSEMTDSQQAVSNQQRLWRQRISEIRHAYNGASAYYQSVKGDAGIPLD